MGLRRSKRLSKADPDRISDLPDSLVLQILSLLGMKDVVKTSVLSKRWENLWTQVPNVVYKYQGKYRAANDQGEPMTDQDWKLQQQPFVPFVDRTLRRHQSNIKRFSLGAIWHFDDKKMHALMDDWIKCVLEKKVEVLELDFSRMIGYILPEFLFQSSSLRELKIKHLFIESSYLFPVRWNLIRSLCLVSIYLDSASLENILLGCPVLESLAIESVTGLEFINIISRSVQKLKIHHFWPQYRYSDTILKIRAPWLEELEISSSFLVGYCQIEDISSLVKATITFNGYESLIWNSKDEELVNDELEINAKWIEMASLTLNALAHVAELSIGTELIQVLSLAIYSGKPSPSFQCKHLTINSPLWEFDVPGIFFLLENAPHLEALLIHVSRHLKGDHPLYRNVELFEDEDIDLSLPNGNFAHLKHVTIDYHRDPCTDNAMSVGSKCYDMELVKYLMRSAIVFKTLVLCSSSPGCINPGCLKGKCAFLYVPRLSSELVSKFLPGNEAEEWELKKRKLSYEYRFSNYASLRFKLL